MSNWENGPEGEVLVPGGCLARDEDGQGCAHGVMHLRKPHVRTGLRRWLEAGHGQAIIRVYQSERADMTEAMETNLFARFGFTPLVRQEVRRTERGGLSFGWAMVVGPLVAPTEKIEVGLRLVCFAKAG